MINFDDLDLDKEMLEQAEELTTKLIERAKEGNHSKFEFIRSLNELEAVRQYEKSSLHVANQFYKMWKFLLKQYKKSIKEDKYDLELILTAKNCNEIAEFYYGEAEITQDIRSEYKSYVFGGHIIDTLVGNYRKEEDLVDYRTLPTKWF